MEELYQAFLELYNKAQKAIETFDAFYVTGCSCSCKEYTMDTLLDLYRQTAILLEDLREARRLLTNDNEDLRYIVEFDIHELQLVLNLLQLVARYDNCENPENTCGLSAVLRRAYVVLCTVVSDMAYLANSTRPKPESTNPPICNNITARQIEPPMPMDNNDEEIARRLRIALGDVEQVERLYNSLLSGFEIDEYEGCGIEDDDYNPLIEEMKQLTKKAIKEVENVQDITTDNDYMCYYCYNYTGLNTTIALLEGLYTTIETIECMFVDFCIASELLTVMDIRVFYPVKTTLIRGIKSTA